MLLQPGDAGGDPPRWYDDSSKTSQDWFNGYGDAEDQARLLLEIFEDMDFKDAPSKQFLASNGINDIPASEVIR